MRIQLTARTRNFTVMANEVLRDRSISFTARGILSYLLSLPDGTREDVRTLADKHPRVGRRGVSKAVDELIAAGYYVRRTTQDPETGRVRTETFVFDVPQKDEDFDLPPRDEEPGAPRWDAEPDAPRREAGSDATRRDEPPLPPPPGTGVPAVGDAGRSPQGTITRGQEPSLPGNCERGAALLGRIGRFEPRLALSTLEIAVLAPLAQRWVDQGVPELEARSLLTDGLPRPLLSARGLLADRLTRKLPPPRPRSDAAAPPEPLPECAMCHGPLPRGQAGGICGCCSGVMVRDADEDHLSDDAYAARASRVRDILRARPRLATR
ncbi:hypothetical protein [Streptomyces sp. NPDC012888]|uniref:hypothetical protein n=1 Tax=Streptomyces sp. NPDC012888 TaxID=3364855 RepID=UPI0036A07A1B